MIKNYKKLQILCNENGQTKILLCNNGKYYTQTLSDRDYIDNEGPLAIYEKQSVNLFEHDVNNIEFPKNIESVSLSLVDKTRFISNKCSIVKTNSRINMGKMSIFFNYPSEEINEMRREFLKQRIEEIKTIFGINIIDNNEESNIKKMLIK